VSKRYKNVPKTTRIMEKKMNLQ